MEINQEYNGNDHKVGVRLEASMAKAWRGARTAWQQLTRKEKRLAVHLRENWDKAAAL